MRTLPSLLCCCAVLLLAGCAEPEPQREAEPPPLPPPETFDWSEAPVRFSPPGPDWERQRVQSAGLQGVRFLRSGAFISVAEYTSLMRKHSLVTERSRRDFDVPRPGFRVGDVVDRVRFDPEAKPPWVKIRSEPLRDAGIGEYAAKGLDYVWDDKGKELRGREYYVVARNHLFVVRFRGKLEDLPLFERVVKTLEFPLPGKEAA